MMIHKYKDKSRNIMGNAKIMDSYNGAIHSNSEKKGAM